MLDIAGLARGLRRIGLLAQLLGVYLTLCFLAFAFSEPVQAQSDQSPGTQMGSIVAIVSDVKGDPVPDANVALEGRDPNDRRTVVANDNDLSCSAGANICRMGCSRDERYAKHP
jgi:hypothetical protein